MPNLLAYLRNAVLPKTAPFRYVRDVARGPVLPVFPAEAEYFKTRDGYQVIESERPLDWESTLEKYESTLEK